VDFSEARDLFVIIFGCRGLTEKSWTVGLNEKVARIFDS
jgi:hypothetical protein